MLKEYSASSLLWVDADSGVCDNCTRSGVYVELLSYKFYHCGEGGALGHRQSNYEVRVNGRQ